MNKFIRNLAIICLIFVIFMAVQILPIIAIFHYRTFAIEPHKTVLVIGDSQTECGVNPEIIPSVGNYSKSGAGLPYSYHVAKAMLEDNPQVDTLILGVSPYSISLVADYRWLGHSNNPASMMFRWSADDWRRLWRVSDVMNRACFLRWIKLLIAPRFADFFGGTYFTSAAEVHLDEVDRSWTTDPKGNETVMHYLNQIVNLCRERGVTLIFLATPIYNASENCDTDYFYNYLSQHYPDIPFWDHLYYEMPRHTFADKNHLNHTGANMFSEMLRERYFK